jgi:DNA processing protein
VRNQGEGGEVEGRGVLMDDAQPSQRQLWYAIHSTSGLGPVAAQRLAVGLRDVNLAVEDLMHRTPEELSDGFGLSDSLAHALAYELEHAWNLRVDDPELLLPGDEAYPNGRFLDAVPPLPVALWAIGLCSLLDNRRPSLGVAGSRDAVDELLELTHRLAGISATQGWDVVSGLAAGVDSAAHQGVVDSGGSTIGVLANGLSSPSRHWQPENLDDVCVVSQFAPSEPWSGPRAMQRNATIAALSDRVFITAAGDRGGSWEMGQLCLKKRKPLYVLDVDTDTAAGNHLLIRGGATAVSADELEVVFREAALDDSPQTLFD